MKSLINKNDNKGFTLIEVIAILILIGILSTVAAITIKGTKDAASLSSTVSTIKSHIRYAQSLSMNTNSIHGIRFWSDSDVRKGYMVFGCPANMIDDFTITCPPNQNDIALPGANAVYYNTNFDIIRLENDITIQGFDSGITGTINTIFFDHYGKPYRYAGGKIGTTANGDFTGNGVAIIKLTAEAEIIIKSPDGTTKTITIEPETGYIK